MGKLNREPRAPQRLRRQAGLSLVEVMVALTILSFGLVTMLAMQIHAMRGGQAGRHHTQAALVARDQMEAFHRVPWPPAPALPDPLIVPTAGWLMGAGTVSPTVMTAGPQEATTYTLDWRVTQDARANLRHIDVRVTWREPNDPPGMPNRRYAISSMRFGG